MTPPPVVLALALIAQDTLSDPELPCNKVPGPLVAATLGRRLLETRNSGWLDPGEARCNYRLAPVGSDTTLKTYVVYIYPERDYDGLREVTEDRADVPAVGDAAYVYVDPDTKRYWLTTVKRGRICISVTGPDLEPVKRLARLALSRYR